MATTSFSALKSGTKKIFQPIDNYIYLYHTDKMLIFPTYPKNITDSSNANFSTTTPLGRSAPIYSYTSSGPRTMQIDLELHREMMNQINMDMNNTLQLPEGMDYVDYLVNQIQSIVYPNYGASEKMVDPPVIAVRFGNEIYCKGVVSNVGVTYDLPILVNDKYALVRITFNMSEIDPFDAETIAQIGSYRANNFSTLGNLRLDLDTPSFAGTNSINWKGISGTNTKQSIQWVDQFIINSELRPADIYHTGRTHDITGIYDIHNTGRTHDVTGRS